MLPPRRRTRVRALLRAGIELARIIMSKKNISREQEEMLAKIAMSERMLAKHWKWLEAAGLLRKRTRWNLSSRSIFYVEMITSVHGPKMPMDNIRNWYNILRMCNNPELVEQFWACHIPREAWSAMHIPGTSGKY